MDRSFLHGKVAADNGKEILYFFTSAKGRSSKFTVTAVNSGDEVWSKTFTAKKWSELLKEAGAESDAALFEMLNEKDTTPSTQHSADALQIAWSRKDEDGLFEEFFSFDLEKTEIPLFSVLSQLLSETEELEKRAVNAEEQLKVVDSKLEKIVERVDDLQKEKDGVEDKLIAKFAALMDTVKSTKK